MFAFPYPLEIFASQRPHWSPVHSKQNQRQALKLRRLKRARRLQKARRRRNAKLA